MLIKNHIKNLLRIEDTTKVIIFGAGKRGMEIYEVLKSIGIPVFAFADNDTKKQTTGVAELPCLSLFELLSMENKKDISILISPIDSKNIEKELGQCQSWRVFTSEVYDIINLIATIKDYKSFFPIGHYYSLYPDISFINENRNRIFDKTRNIMDVKLWGEGILKQMQSYYKEIPKWKNLEDKTESEFRYRYNNPSFPPADAIALYCILRLIEPSHIIEVGSGWSSAVILDTNEFFFNKATELAFIEPYPLSLQSILKHTDNIKLKDVGLQEVPVDYFSKLEAGDMLFIDSTHVSKAGSDVNYLFFEILPRLKSGVYIHLHDIFYPFEYPEDWIRKGQVWNELYLLRAFLQNNNDYEVVYFQNMMDEKYKELFLEHWPLPEPYQKTGGSFYMRKR